MNITDIKIRKLLSEGRLRAIVSITIDNTIALHDIKIIEGPSRLFVAMPSRRDDNGIFRDIVHPISVEGRVAIEEIILTAYGNYLAEHEDNLYDQ
ncbi:MAG: septation regulator SpoVG [Oscillospiraceae bacterium]